MRLKAHSDFLLQDELKEAMEMIGEPVTEQELNNLIELADIDHDGRIDYEGKKNRKFLCG